MRLKDSIGKTITDILELVFTGDDGLDYGSTFIQLDNKYVINIPFAPSTESILSAPSGEEKSLFVNLSDHPVYHFSLDNKKPVVDRVEYQENILNHIKDKKITDYFWYPGDDEKGVFLLENGFLITDTLVAFHGTGLAGLNICRSLNEMIDRKGNGFCKFSESSLYLE